MVLRRIFFDSDSRTFARTLIFWLNIVGYLLIFWSVVHHSFHFPLLLYLCSLFFLFICTNWIKANAGFMSIVLKNAAEFLEFVSDIWIRVLHYVFSASESTFFFVSSEIVSKKKLQAISLKRKIIKTSIKNGFSIGKCVLSLCHGIYAIAAK